MAHFDGQEVRDENTEESEIFSHDSSDGNEGSNDDTESDDTESEDSESGDSGEAPVPADFVIHEEGEGEKAETPNPTQVEEGSELTEPSQEAPKRKRKGKNWGQVRQGESGWWWCPSEDPSPDAQWVRATLFTGQVRREMIQEMAQQGRYSHPRPDGDGQNDRTAYHPDQGSWGPSRQDRPDILFQYEKRPKPQSERDAQRNPGPLMHRGQVVLAPDATPRRPVWDYPEIPKTLSSAEQGWSLEAMSRLNEFIQLEDFRDRMPPGDRCPNLRTLSMRRSRYRWNSGTLSWSQRDGTRAIKEYLDKLIPEHLLKENTTKGFRDLEDDEIEEMKAASKGKFPERRRKSKQAEAVEEPPAESGPSNQKVQKKPEKARSRSPERSRSPHRKPGWYRRRNPTPEVEDRSKAKAVASGSAEEEPQADESAQIEEPADWRDDIPQERDEYIIVHHALMITRLEISFLTGRPTPQTNIRTSYNDQWEELRAHLAAWYVANDIHLRDRKRPEKHGPWREGFPVHFLQYQGEIAKIERNV